MLNRFRANRLAERLLDPELQRENNRHLGIGYGSSDALKRILKAIDAISNGRTYAADRLRHDVASSTGERREAAIRMLSELGFREGDVPLVIDALNDSYPGVRRVAANVIVKGRFEPSRVLPVLAARLTDSDAGVREAVISALGRFGGASSPYVSQIAPFLNDLGLAEKVAVTLWSIGKESLPRDVRVSCRIADDRSMDWDVRIDITCQPIIQEMLMGDWRDSWERARVYTRALRMFKAIRAPIMEPVRSKMEELAKYSWQRGDGKSLSDAQELALDILKTAIDFKDPGQVSAQLVSGSSAMRGSALEAVAATGMCTAEIISGLASVAGQHDDPSNQSRAIELLASLGPRAAQALPVLRALLRQAAAPVTQADFREQEELLGGLRESNWEQIASGAPRMPRLLADLRPAIAAIEGK